ncbi:MAG TPA: zinc-dependent metalloprotease [Thermoanaerobaculia bacterium]|nr:zinc-dependent metalloprotease [Thermoanaerobaculia bacterium]
MHFLTLAVLLVSASAAPAAEKAAEKPPAEKPSGEMPSIAGRTQGLERREGFLAFFWDAGRGQFLLEIRTGEEFLYGSGLAGGAGLLEVDLDRGQLGELGVCRFERVGPRVLLVQRQTTHGAGVDDSERTRVVEESFPSSIRASFPIVAEQGDRVLVDATAFLLADVDVLPALGRAHLGEWKQDLSRSALNFDRTGAFPRNTEIEVLQTFVSENPPASVVNVLPDGHTMSLRVHHTFLRLPEPGYRPRAFDPRIGFIPRRHLDHAAPFTEPIEKYWVSRWRLQKKDPAAAVSEPVQPILYYLDRGIPEPERTAIREAALWWNHAFERAGFRNAFVIRDLPAGATFLDARYSGIEWISRAERGWSIGDAQVDPRTGEILHGVARIDSHRRRTTARMWRNLERPSPGNACRAAESPDLSFLAAGGDEAPGEEALVLQRLAYLSAHEVGHTLGLEHNWAATTFGWGSVMDYLAPNIQIRDGALDLSDAYPKDVGSYDRLAIQWGYTEEDDPKRLDAIVRAGYEGGIFYPLQGDPRWAEYDWGPDPVRWLSTTQAVRRVILDRFGAGQLKPGEWVYTLQERFNLAYLYHRFGIQAAQQFVGGQFQASAVAGDGQTPLAWVPAGKQREALDLLLNALEPENLDIPDRVLAVLIPPPDDTRKSREQFPSEAGSTFDRLTAARILAALIVDPLVEPERAARLALASGPGALTLDRVLERLIAATWGARPDSSEHRAGLRRVAQREVLDALMDLAASPRASVEVRAAVFSRLTRLRRELRARQPADPLAEAHVRLAERDLSEFLERPERRAPRPPRLEAPPGRPIGG